MSIESLMRESITEQLSELKKMEVGTEEHKLAVESITKMVDRVIEMDKVDLDHIDVIEGREAEYEFKSKQLKADRRDRWMNYLIAGVGIGVPAMLKIWGTKVSLKFEETGTFTSIPGRMFIQELISGKK